jgi:Mg-chelatase subunit ChlD
VVVVVDISGSMGAACTAQDENGQAMENGFSTLDIVKHSTKTVLETLRPQDRLAVIPYDDRVDVLFDLTEMNKQNQKACSAQIDALGTRGATDIFSAVKKAVEIIETR